MNAIGKLLVGGPVVTGGASALLEAGARFIGGCCGTGPAFVRAARNRVSGCA